MSDVSITTPPVEYPTRQEVESQIEDIKQWLNVFATMSQQQPAKSAMLARLEGFIQGMDAHEALNASVNKMATEEEPKIEDVDAPLG